MSAGEVRLLDAGVVRPGAAVVVTTARPARRVTGRRTAVARQQSRSAARRATSPTARRTATAPVRRRRTARLVAALVAAPVVLAGSSFLLGFYGVGSALLSRLVGLLFAVLLLLSGLAVVASRSLGVHCPGCPD